MSQPAIQFQHVSFTVGDKVVLQDITVAIEKGEFVAILGPNGSGKSTFLKLVAGLLTPDEGKVLIDGEEVQGGSMRIGYSPQTKPYESDMPITGRDYVKLGLIGTHMGVVFPDAHVKKRVDEVLHEFDAYDIAKKRLGNLSGGEQQRISLAQAMVSEPDVILLDEPLANLDLSYQKEIVERISSNHKDHGHTILLVAHDVNPLLPYIDRVIYIANGHIEVGKAEEVITDERLSILYGVPVHVFTIDGRIFVAALDGVVH